MNRFFTLLFFLLGLCSCTKQTNHCPDVILNVPTSSLPMDLFGVNEVELVGDELRVSVNYGGGCEQHEFQAYGSTSTNEEGAEVSVLFLSHDANNDVCEALILEHQLCFDLPQSTDSHLLYFSHLDSLYHLN